MKATLQLQHYRVSYWFVIFIGTSCIIEPLTYGGSGTGGTVVWIAAAVDSGCVVLNIVQLSVERGMRGVGGGLTIAPIPSHSDTASPVKRPAPAPWNIRNN